ncbi:fibrinogen C domain-containing protein 1-B-like isoform X2 [Gigantopelta aegis]|uniref:fibrinogen C domain-containing protein 1-B-like isoform X2 n=1 Tax=Gigantopelta aegis TaxID=1735272 RepID=UPI001B889B53|nr:fibrinogen C domain-containing protein 1-B-like isoform X2 [Gigantopelta aegis]
MWRGAAIIAACLFLQAVSADDCDYPQDCHEIKEDMNTGTPRCSGVYTIYPLDNRNPISVYCDMTTDGGGWLVFQRREDGSEIFYRTWEDYLNGFGKLSKEFWLGNENIHRLTHQRPYEMRVDLEDWNGKKAYAVYNYFSIGSVTDYYKLFVMGYSGDAGDSFSGHNGYFFSAKNLDKDTWANSCAEKFGGGWWYSKCHGSNLNGYYLSGNHTSYANGVDWRAFRGYHHSMRKVEMKIRPMKKLLKK